MAMANPDLFDGIPDDPAPEPIATKKLEMTAAEFDAETARLEAAWDTFIDRRVGFLVREAEREWTEHHAAVTAWHKKGSTAKGRASRGEFPRTWYDSGPGHAGECKSAEEIAVAWIGIEAAELIVARTCDASPHISLGEVADALCRAGIDPDGRPGRPWSTCYFTALYDAYRLQVYRVFEKDRPTA